MNNLLYYGDWEGTYSSEHIPMWFRNKYSEEVEAYDSKVDKWSNSKDPVDKAKSAIIRGVTAWYSGSNNYFLLKEEDGKYILTVPDYEFKKVNFLGITIDSYWTVEKLFISKEEYCDLMFRRKVYNSMLEDLREKEEARLHRGWIKWYNKNVIKPLEDE